MIVCDVDTLLSIIVLLNNFLREVTHLGGEEAFSIISRHLKECTLRNIKFRKSLWRIWWSVAEFIIRQTKQLSVYIDITDCGYW